ncbi:MAG: TonB-dependent receptor plug domain-containing protein, partial [Acidobacteria bacterium]|nr:TonB-dependent receptor plug domain-containing protein [Acidobacteriota bacterium]
MRMISSRLVVVVKGKAMRLAICLWLALLGLPGLVLNEFRVEAWAAQDLAQLSLEELMMVEVSTVGKRSQTLSETPAAIYVLTQEEIRRSGATSIPEALRRVPGLNVAQLNSNQWAISARGFNGLFANKVLVLIDGRNVYSPLFAGVNWDVQDMLLEDVERIEVIRGPGATLWGANATNGVINIITKRAEDTQGGLLTGGFGSVEKGFGGVRYGGQIGQEAFYRFYAKYFNRDGLTRLDGRKGADDWDSLRGGFRMDWSGPGGNSLTMQGDIYHADTGVTQTFAAISPPFQSTVDNRRELNGGHLLGRWQHNYSPTSTTQLQFYYDRAERKEILLEEVRDTFDLDFQHQFSWGARHNIVWGAGYRYTKDDLQNSFVLTFSPNERGDHLFSGFAEDEIELVSNWLSLILGFKLEENDSTGFEIQPSARLAWTPSIRQTGWASVTRAVRTPNRFIEDVRIRLAVIPNPQGPLTILSILGSRDVKSDNILAYELGYRYQPTPDVSLDVATFYNLYSDLLSTEPASPFFESSPPPPHLVVPLRFDNQLEGETYGLEAIVAWQAASRWKLRASYSWLDIQLHRQPTSVDA